MIKRLILFFMAAFLILSFLNGCKTKRDKAKIEITVDQDPIRLTYDQALEKWHCSFYAFLTETNGVGCTLGQVALDVGGRAVATELNAGRIAPFARKTIHFEGYKTRTMNDTPGSHCEVVITAVGEDDNGNPIRDSNTFSGQYIF